MAPWRSGAHLYRATSTVQPMSLSKGELLSIATEAGETYILKPADRDSGGSEISSTGSSAQDNGQDTLERRS